LACIPDRRWDAGGTFPAHGEYKAAAVQESLPDRPSGKLHKTASGRPLLRQHFAPVTDQVRPACGRVWEHRLFVGRKPKVFTPDHED
jgi:hypothetical protein